MSDVLARLDRANLTFGPLTPQHGEVVVAQNDALDTGNLDDTPGPPSRNDTLTFPTHHHGRLFAEGGGHGANTAKAIEDRRRGGGVLTVHIPHVTHKSSVRQSHFERVCENGTVATVNHREILQALAALDLTQEQIGAVIGRDRSAVSRLLTGKRAMKTSEVEILTALIETTRAEREGRPLVSEPQRENEVQAAPPPINAVALPKDVPVHGTALGGDLAIDGITHDMKVEQTVLEISDVIEMVRRPPSFAGNRSLYAVYVAGSSMEPRYEPGDLLYVDPRRPPSIGDDVIVQLRDGNGHDGEDRVICALIKRLVRRSTAGVELEQYNPPLRFTIAVHHVAAVHRVVKMGEVLGV